ncbi:aldehyde dehydrogenase family protein [Flammeovirga yaeyamensis]|uniref:Aldehyde dehydrogenase family protein n=1 Tax=Flammeovirga yaeyamensis TaxID=367791 RepID=A0AAX1N931_9BACT|nr:aldehyde dehydrogenase family protein [Flammeovirga yaeyamensis]MBB3698939.1 aldehyde dehydrogenase (NAD+)/phenylacetaldehyde dehydrogenase [Flammeovirga yaeyamensis]QWG03666.1 aldehyde dehydrogenase family protein [Flammeovirga yaeyamensis]
MEKIIIPSRLQMLIGGEWVDANNKESLSVINPANAQEITTVPLAAKEDIDIAVDSAQLAFENDTLTPAERGQLLHKVADLLERDKEYLMHLESLDNGKPFDKAAYDVDSCIHHFRYYAGWTTKIHGDQIPVSSPNKLVYTRQEPLGVVGLIVPWNFPLMMSVWKVAPALACGNTCILKPAEQTPLTALHLGKLIMEAGFPKGYFNVVTGTGAITGEAITRHQKVAKISFTGSTDVGKKIMVAAAESNLKKVSLELGGKSPNIVFDDADIDQVIESVVWSSFYNSGQECTLGSRLYIHEKVYDQVLKGLIDKTSQLSIGKGIDSPDLGPLISETQMNRVLSYIALGKKEAQLEFGGHRLEGDLKEGYFVSPTIFSHQNDDLKIVQEEIFGPVVVVSSFKDEGEIIQRANHSIFGLAAALWTKDVSKAHRVAHQIQSGTVWINGYDMFDPSVPFGGYKQSGNGREMGKSAIDLYTQEKAVWLSL